MLLPNELWSMILGHNYHQFCVEVSHVIPWIYWKSYVNELITESIIGHLLRKVDINAIIFRRTPLLLACKYLPSAVQLLIGHGADVNAAYGWTPLMTACHYQPSIVPLLIEHGANVNVAAYYGWTPLILAL